MIRAFIHEPFITAPDAVAISLIREIDQPGFHERHILQLLAGEDGRIIGRNWVPFETGALEPMAPTLSLGHEEARVIANALVGYFGGVDDQRALRRDYDHERERRDKLEDALIDAVRADRRG